MNESERLLALDAACCAAEGAGTKETQVALALLQDCLEKESGLNIEPFGSFLQKQKKAVEALAKNPHVFGG